MRFGTTTTEKAQVALAAAAAVGFLTARNQNRLGAVLVAGPHLKVMPPRSGRDQVRAILANVASPPPSEGLGRADLAGAIDRVAVVSKRRGFVAVIVRLRRRRRGSTRSPGSGCATTCWRSRSTTHASSTSRRSGWSSSSTRRPGRRREVRVTAAVQRRFAEAAAEAGRASSRFALRRAGADLIELATDGDWLGAIVSHVTPPPRPGRQRPGPAAMTDTPSDAPRIAPMIADDFLPPERLWLLLAVLALGRSRYVAVLRWRPPATVRFTQVDLLDQVAPQRPGGAATSSPRCSSLGLAAGVVAIARPISTTTERTESEGRILVLFDVSLSMVATDVPARPPRRRPSRRRRTSSTRSPTTSRSA